MFICNKVVITKYGSLEMRNNWMELLEQIRAIIRIPEVHS